MYRVVIVEDDPMVSLLNRTFVERDARFQVVQSFQDGRAALAWLEQNPADLAVLDVYMPLFTGLELLHALRGGYLTDEGKEGLTIDETYQGIPLRLSVTLNNEDMPAFAEIFQDGERILSLTLTNFRFL